MEQMNYDRVAPQAIELEVATLGAILIERDAIQDVSNILNGDCFYLEKHQKIWHAVISLYHEQSPIDMLTVCEQLKSLGEYEMVGGAAYIASLTNSIGSAANAETHAYLLKEKYLRRKLISIQMRVIRDLYDDATDVISTFDGLMTSLDCLTNEITRIQHADFADEVISRIEELKLASSTNYKTGIVSHIDALDRQTMGFQPTDLIIIAARPSMGKTAFAIDCARKQVRDDIPVGFFSLEMSSRQIIDRIIAAEMSIDLKNVRKGGLTKNRWTELDSATNRLIGYPLYVCQKGGISINDLCVVAKQWKVKHQIKALYIDYLQLIVGSKDKRYGNREQEVSEISRRLKQLAKDLDIPVIALAQLSRKCEERTDKRPMLSDLRESGSIENDADLIIFPFREEYYNDNAEKGSCELIVAKYRNGQTGMIKCRFEAEYQRFIDY